MNPLLQTPVALLVGLSVFGSPQVTWLERDLTSTSPRARGSSAEAAARAHLAAEAHRFGISPALLAATVLEHLHDVGAGAVVVSFRAQFGEVPVFLHRVSVVMDREHRAVALFGGLPAIAFQPTRLDFRLSDHAALALALPGAAWVRLPSRDGDGWWSSPAARGRTRQVAFALPDRLEPAWYLELEADQAHALVISARDGALLFRQSLDRDSTYRVWPDDGPQGSAASPHPTGRPDGWQAQWTSPSLVTLDHGPISTLDPWLPAGATECTGNNVDAYADLAAPDGFGAGDLRPRADAGVFGAAYDLGAAPGSSSQQQAGSTQLFYTLNFLHDWFYDVGFNEAAGNAQADNKGRGGRAGDRLLAESQDHAVRNNAFMRTPADGSPPRLSIGVYDSNGRAVASLTTPTARDFPAATASFGPQTFDRSAGLALVDDGVAPSADGCEAPLALAGKIALIDRGLCPFTTKAANAQAAGAIGVVIANNAPGAAPALTGTDPAITIPVLSVTQGDGVALKAAATAGGAAVRLVREAAIDHDGALDNGVVAHEWAHLLTNRLVGDGSGLYLSQAWAMGEGWSDFVAILLSLRQGDETLGANLNWNGAYAMGGYARQGLIPDVWYYSSRRLPYSVDPKKNALTFKHISANEPLPANVPTRFGQDGSDNVRPHTAGEVWASMLWECAVALLRDVPRLSFDEALLRLRRYLVASLKATPPAPTFLEARDALLAVAYASDPADHRLFVQAFARRGAGLRAVAPPRTAADHRPLVEDFSSGSDLAFVDAAVSDDLAACDDDGVLDRGEAGTLVVRFRNSGLARLEATTLTLEAADGGVRLLDPAPVRLPASVPQQTVEAAMRVTLEPGFAGATVALKLSASDPGLTLPGPVVGTVILPANRDATAGLTDDVETGSSPWTFGAGSGSLPGFGWKRLAEAPTAHFFRAPASDGQTDLYLVSPPLSVTAAPFQVSFKHRHQLNAQGAEAYEGAVIELSADDGQTWTDVGAAATPGYQGPVDTGGGRNVLSGRRAFIGLSTGYPGWVAATLDLGATYVGKTVKLRFRLATDEGGAAVGWDLDDLAFTGVAGSPFSRLTAEPAACTQRRPIAVIAPSPGAAAGAQGVLDGSRSFDLDGDPLLFRWRQLAGPDVALTNGSSAQPSFVAPRTPGATLEFELVVNDGKADSKPARTSVQVTAGTDAPRGCGCSGAPLGPWLLAALLVLRRRSRPRG